MPTIGASVITTVGEGMFLLHSSTGDFWIDDFPFISQSSHTYVTGPAAVVLQA
jgi:hypothetical protein